jgi:hypothetical protein
MKKPIIRKLRCAVYTRKSSEEGLEQEFNSLDAQREACEAYIASQKPEGWVLVPDHYDDGGISGATLERGRGVERLRHADERDVVPVGQKRHISAANPTRQCGALLAKARQYWPIRWGSIELENIFQDRLAEGVRLGSNGLLSWCDRSSTWECDRDPNRPLKRQRNSRQKSFACHSVEAKNLRIYGAYADQPEHRNSYRSIPG